MAMDLTWIDECYSKCYNICYNILSNDERKHMDFKEKVKKVRLETGYSQEQLARELGVSFATINRWENGKSEPRQIALNMFKQFCDLHNIFVEEEY